MEDISEKDLKARWDKKKSSIVNFSSKLNKLKRKINSDLKIGDEKEFLSALAIMLMIKTAERVGNNVSAKNGHFGVTGFKKKHIEIFNDGLIYLDYIGKSGVDHQKIIQDKRLADFLQEAIDYSPNEKVFVTSEGFAIKSDRINRYLNNYGISSKDIRGFSANKYVYDKLKKIKAEDTENKRKTQFNKIAKEVAERVGHGSATLQKHYLVPEMKEMFIAGGRIKRLSRKYNL